MSAEPSRRPELFVVPASQSMGVWVPATTSGRVSTVTSILSCLTPASGVFEVEEWLAGHLRIHGMAIWSWPASCL